MNEQEYEKLKIEMHELKSELLFLKRHFSEIAESNEKSAHAIAYSHERTSTFIDSEEEFKVELQSKNRWFKETDDGWIVTLDSSNARLSLSSYLKVDFLGPVNGRDKLKVLEGIYKNKEVSIKADSGFLDSTNLHGEAANIIFEKRPAPITIGETVYDKQISISYKVGTGTQTVGPFPALTDKDNPVPVGSNTVQIPDYPHDLGSQYGAFGKVWFRIGTSGDRYIHPGRVSAGCITCEPSNWTDIYRALVVRRKSDDLSVGDLTVR